MVDCLRKLGLLVALTCVATIAQADSYPPGDNMPFLVGELDGTARIYYFCVDYQDDDGVMQCGKSNVASQTDCYYQEISKVGALAPTRKLYPCRARPSSGEPVAETILEAYKKFEDELIDVNATTVQGTSILAMRSDSWVPTILKYGTGSRTTLPVLWDGWLFNPSSGQSLAATDSLIALTGRACKGDSNTPYKPGLDSYFSCGEYQKNSGDFSLALIDRNSNRVHMEPIGNPAGYIAGDIVSTPIFAGNSIFVGWAKSLPDATVLEISSWSLKDMKRCDWSIDQPDAIDPPTDIGFLPLGNKLLAAFARDGIISLLKIDPDKWAKSCGQDGITVNTVPRIR